MKPCSECKRGEESPEPTDGKLYMVRDPETGAIYLRGYLCADHIDTLMTDGYTVTDTQETGK